CPFSLPAFFAKSAVLARGTTLATVDRAASPSGVAPSRETTRAAAERISGSRSFIVLTFLRGDRCTARPRTTPSRLRLGPDVVLALRLLREQLGRQEPQLLHGLLGEQPGEERHGREPERAGRVDVARGREEAGPQHDVEHRAAQRADDRQHEVERQPAPAELPVPDVPGQRPERVDESAECPTEGDDDEEELLARDVRLPGEE